MYPKLINIGLGIVVVANSKKHHEALIRADIITWISALVLTVICVGGYYAM